ncbi:MAG: thiamine-phosphate kinase, partial [Candidatus Aminicenantes bacterium]|nr:thiamine-phosphate kinase [Candidatus Aminicenantes bacterium]
MTESELIRWIRNQKQEETPFVLKGVGDDCAVFDPGLQSRLVVSTDVLVEGVHFRRRWMHPYFLGRKSLLVN